MPWVPAMLQDFRYALRQLRRSPGFAMVCVLTLALGIGANTAIFSVMNTVLLRFLPVRNPQQLVYFHFVNQPSGSSQTGFGDLSLPLSVYEQLGTERRAFSGVLAFAPMAFGKVSVRVGAEPEEALGEEVSGNFFSVLGVPMAHGRGFTANDEAQHAATAVLSHSWWMSRFGGDPDVLGRVVYIKGLPFTIVGIAGPGFDGVDPQGRMDFWVPLQNRPELNIWGIPATDETLYGSPDWYALVIMGRLSPGITWAQAIAQVTPAFQRAMYAGIPTHDPHEPKPLLVFSSARGVENLRGPYQRPLRFLLGMVGVVLLIACANVAMLLAARNSARQREFGVRVALGAGRAVLFRQLAAESVLLVAGGAVIGWYLSISITGQLTRWAGLDLDVAPDANALWFTLAIAAVAAFSFGLIPLRSAAHVSLASAMKTSASTANTDRSRFRGRNLVVASQIALCVVVLVAAGLLVSSLRNLEARDPGMRTAGLAVFGVNPQRNVHSDAEAVRFHQFVLARMSRLPGVEAATLTQLRFGAGVANNDGVLVDGRNPLPAQGFAPIRWNAVGPGFLRVMGIPLLAGRDISESDTGAAEKVAIVNRTFVDRYLPRQQPLGHHIRLLGDKTQYTIVGVARNSVYMGLDEKERPMAWLAYTQVTGVYGMEYELRSAGSPLLVLREAARAMRRIDPDVPLEKPMAQQAVLEHSISEDRLIARLALWFGVLAAVLVAVGLYGTLSYAIGRRTVEIGLRMALGAERGRVLWMVLRETLMLAGIGVCVGIPAALGVAQALRAMLYGLQPADPRVLAAAVGAIACVAIAAALLPARRAATVDPLKALRSE